MGMAGIRKTAEKTESGRRLGNLVALDFATTGIKAIRLKRGKERIALAAIDLLPPLDPNDGERPDLPKALFSYYTALCATMQDVQVRVFSDLLTDDKPVDESVRENLGVEEGYRIAGRVLARGKAKKESQVLGVAVPERTVQGCLEKFSIGAPAPRSLELSGLSACSAFLRTCGKRLEDRTFCLIELGASCSYLAFFQGTVLKMINRIETGGEDLAEAVRQDLKIDQEMITSILFNGEVNVNAPVRRVFSDLLRQVSIGREFVERQTHSVLSAVYLSGGLASSPAVRSVIGETLGMDPKGWNPFEELEMPPEGLPEKFKGQESRFAAVIGAALAAMEGTWI